MAYHNLLSIRRPASPLLAPGAWPRGRGLAVALAAAEAAQPAGQPGRQRQRKQQPPRRAAPAAPGGEEARPSGGQQQERAQRRRESKSRPRINSITSLEQLEALLQASGDQDASQLCALFIRYTYLLQLAGPRKQPSLPQLRFLGTLLELLTPKIAQAPVGHVTYAVYALAKLQELTPLRGMPAHRPFLAAACAQLLEPSGEALADESVESSCLARLSWGMAKLGVGSRAHWTALCKVGDDG